MSECRHEGRLIRITPGQVTTGGEEVELIAVIAVAAGNGDEQREHHAGGNERPGVRA